MEKLYYTIIRLYTPQNRYYILNKQNLILKYAILCKGIHLHLMQKVLPLR